MGDGTTKPIQDIQPGDHVMAADPETGEQGPRQVTATWPHTDTLYQLVLTDGSTIDTTEDHPFWNATDKQWQRADELDPGDQLTADNGSNLGVEGISPDTARLDRAYNLTVNDLHTYYVLAGQTPVLVHNANRCGTYENPGHHDPKGGPNPYNPNKAVLPSDAAERFANSVMVDGTRWAKIGNGKKAVYYRYSDNGHGLFHFSGSTNGVSARGVEMSIPLDQVPIVVRRG